MDQIFSLRDKVALITGASSGLGVQFAKALAGQGAKIALMARRKEKIESVATEIRAIGVEVIPVVADVTNEEQVKEGVSQVVREYGRIDILVNNAGVSEISPAESMSMEAWRKVIDTNLTGVFTVAREVGKKMVEQQYGRIINIASMFGTVGNTAFPVVNYHASKFGVVGITKSLAAEWAKYNITVNAIGPGFFESEMTSEAINTPEFNQYVQVSCPMKRVGKAGELDGVVLLLASDASSYITGQIICVDGGWTSV